MAHKPLRTPNRLTHRYRNHTYIVAYKIHFANERLYEVVGQDLPAERLIDSALLEMEGLHVLGSVWIVKVPGYSPKNLRDRLRDCLDDGDELLIAPLSRPDHVTGLEIKPALKILSEWSSAVGEA